MKNNYLALGGLFASLHVLFLLMSEFLPGSELLLVLFLPLLSTLYTVKCDKKSILLFIISTILVCSIFNVVGTFIYVVPCLVVGVLYGFLRKARFKELELLCISGFGHMISLLLSFSVIALLFKEVDFMNIFSKIFNVSGDNLIVIVLSFFLVLGFCEAFLVHVISDNELARFTSKVEKNENVPFWFMIGAFISLTSYLVLSIFGSVYCILAMLLVFVFVIPYIVYGIYNLKYKFLTTSLIIVFAFISIFSMKYLSPINYLFLPLFIMSPFIINNFKDNK